MSKFLLLLLLFFFSSCQSEKIDPKEARERVDSLIKIYSLKYEEFLIRPLAIEHARDIFKEKRGNFHDAILFMDEEGTLEDIHLIEGVIEYFENNKNELKRLPKCFHHKGGYLGECKEVIEKIKERNLSKFRK